MRRYDMHASALLKFVMGKSDHDGLQKLVSPASTSLEWRSGNCGAVMLQANSRKMRITMRVIVMSVAVLPRG